MTALPRGRQAVTIVVPARNEEAGLASVLAALPLATLRTAGYEPEVIVLDGHSNDATGAIARRMGATVIPDRRRGKGAAMTDARSRMSGEYVVMLDADGSYAPDAIPRLLDPLVRGDADIVMGDRVAGVGAMTPIHRAGNRILSLAASVLYARPCRDLCTGMWAFRAAALQALPLQEVGFELEAEAFALASRLGMRIQHTRVDYLPRQGQAKLGPWDGLRIGWCLVRSRFLALPPLGLPTRLVRA
ncbi:MAG: glycosyltransferase family 2 protein [Thermoplasmatota archaeon]